MNLETEKPMRPISCCKVAVLLLVGLGSLAVLPTLTRADERDEQNRRDRMKEIERQTERNLEEIRNRPRYAAIAYSRKTGKWGSSYNFFFPNEARKFALKQCGEADAEIVVSAWGGWYVALATGDDGYGAASGATPEAAKAAALKFCRKHTTNAKIVYCVCSEK